MAIPWEVILMKKDIYIIRNDINDKVYIGQSVNAEERFAKHCSDSKLKRDNMIIHEAMRKYGTEHFSLEILESQVSDFNAREIYWIEYYNSIQPNGYNINIGGEGVGSGINHPSSSFKSKEILDELYRDLKENKISMKNLAEKYNVSETTISTINTGKYYYDDTLTYPIRPPLQYSEEMCKQLAYSLKYEQEKSLQEIAQEFNIDYSQLVEFNNGRTHYKDWLSYPLRVSKELRVKNIVPNIIHDLLNTTVSQKDIARKYNVSAMTVSYINTGKRHKQEELSYPLRKNTKKNPVGFTCLSPDLVKTIREELALTTLSLNKIGQKYEVPAPTVAGINNGSIKKYRDETIKYPIRNKK